MSDDQTVEIAPCPYCGHECEVIQRPTGLTLVWCTSLELYCPYHYRLSGRFVTVAEAIAAHNALCADVQRGRDAAKIEQTARDLRHENEALLDMIDKAEAERDALRAEVERLRGVANIAAAIVRALLGAMPPSLQRKWPVIVGKASAFLLEVNDCAALDAGKGEKRG